MAEDARLGKKEGRKGISFENLQKKIAGKNSRTMKWEVRQGQKQKIAPKSGAFLALHQPLTVSLTVPSSLEALVKWSSFF